MSLERKIEINPAYDKRSNDPKKNYGIHGVEMRWLVIGPLGAVQFLLYTNWQLKHVQDEFDAKFLDRDFPHLFCHPQPADIGYHAYVPQYEGQEPFTDKCHYLGDRPCYYDGSGLRATEFYDILVAGGGEALWQALEEEYVRIFKSKEARPGLGEMIQIIIGKQGASE